MCIDRSQQSSLHLARSSATGYSRRRFRRSYLDPDVQVGHAQPVEVILVSIVSSVHDFHKRGSICTDVRKKFSVIYTHMRCACVFCNENVFSLLIPSTASNRNQSNREICFRFLDLMNVSPFARAHLIEVRSSSLQSPESSCQYNVRAVCQIENGRRIVRTVCQNIYIGFRSERKFRRKNFLWVGSEKIFQKIFRQRISPPCESRVYVEVHAEPLFIDTFLLSHFFCARRIPKRPLSIYCISTG
jgi:hypothetical protein